MIQSLKWFTSGLLFHHVEVGLDECSTFCRLKVFMDFLTLKVSGLLFVDPELLYVAKANVFTLQQRDV